MISSSLRRVGSNVRTASDVWRDTGRCRPPRNRFGAAPFSSMPITCRPCSSATPCSGTGSGTRFRATQGIIRGWGTGRRQQRPERILENVVAEEHQAAAVLAEQLGQAQRLGDAAGLVLDAIGQGGSRARGPEPSNSTKSPMCSVPVTIRISRMPASISFFNRIRSSALARSAGGACSSPW